jgi:hypothetical protein
MTLVCSPQFDRSLFLNTLQGADRYVAVRVRHRYPSILGRVLELFVASDLIDLITSRHPSISL